MQLAFAMLLGLFAARATRAPPPRLLFGQFFKPPPTPADVYKPVSCAPARLPQSYDEVHATAIDGVRAALDSNERAVEVEFPPLASANARGDGSAKSERRTHEANAAFVSKLERSLARNGRRVVVVACTGGAASALGPTAVSLRDAPSAATRSSVFVCVAPFSDEQWDAVEALGAADGTVMVVNGLLSNGRLPHAYYYKPLTAFSTQTGGVVRRYPGPYEVYDAPVYDAPLSPWSCRWRSRRWAGARCPTPRARRCSCSQRSGSKPSAVVVHCTVERALL